MNATKKKDDGQVPDSNTGRPICGVVRPIADMADYTSAHWENVHDILCEAAADAGYECRLVSENESVGVILGNIVSNLYSDPIVICDVSGKNPNVMFELGMRIAFEKPVIIITDDSTGYSFDISPVKHLTYPRTLRYDKIISFKKELKSAIEATVASYTSENHKGYLQQFGPIKVAELGTQEVTLEKIITGMQDMGRVIRSIESKLPASARQSFNKIHRSRSTHGSHIAIDISSSADWDINSLAGRLHSIDGVYRVLKVENEMQAYFDEGISAQQMHEISKAVEQIAPTASWVIKHS